MSINYYVGVEGPTIVIESIDDLKEAINLLHTQTMDAELPNEFLAVLEKTIEELEAIETEN